MLSPENVPGLANGPAFWRDRKRTAALWSDKAALGFPKCGGSSDWKATQEGYCYERYETKATASLALPCVWGPLRAPALHNSKKGLKGIAQQKICGSCPAPTTETYVKCILGGSLVSAFN